MSRHSKINPKEKVEAVEKYLRDEASQNLVAKEYHISTGTFRDWISIYEAEGPVGLLEQPKNRCYPKSLKMAAVLDYLDGKDSLQNLCKKYKIRSRCQLRQWIKVYNDGKRLREFTGGSSMKKAGSTTYEKRLKIVRDCLENDRNYGAMAIKYHCSYQQVRNWVKKYEEMGEAGLEDRRGHRIGSQPSRTPEEELRDRIAELEHRNKNLQMENDLLKKVKELEGRNRRYH